MDILFKLWADSGAWLEHGGDGQASHGTPVVGPKELLGVLETMLGLSTKVRSLFCLPADSGCYPINAAGAERFAPSQSRRSDPG